MIFTEIVVTLQLTRNVPRSPENFRNPLQFLEKYILATFAPERNTPWNPKTTRSNQRKEHPMRIHFKK
jgi:hypothetical protein